MGSPMIAYSGRGQDALNGGQDRYRVRLLVRLEALVVHAAVQVDGQRRNLQDRTAR